MNRDKVKLLVAAGTAISFILVILTGLFKWSEIIIKFSWIYGYVRPSLMKKIHGLSGAIMTLFVIVHLL